MAKKVTRVSFAELKEATGNFSKHNYIGLGKIGIMYKAMLPNGYPLAVKRLYKSQSLEKQFKSELSALARLRHNNIISLLGHCRERKEMLLVYRYIYRMVTSMAGYMLGKTRIRSWTGLQGLKLS